MNSPNFQPAYEDRLRQLRDSNSKEPQSGNHSAGSVNTPMVVLKGADLGQHTISHPSLKQIGRSAIMCQLMRMRPDFPRFKKELTEERMSRPK